MDIPKTLLGLALALGLCLGACHREKEESPYATPEATVRAYARAMKDGDFEAALACYADTALSDTGIGVVGLSRDEIRNLFLKSLANSQEPYAHNEPKNLRARYVTAEVSYDLGGESHTHTLVNVNGEWKIATDLTR